MILLIRQDTDLKKEGRINRPVSETYLSGRNT